MEAFEMIKLKIKAEPAMALPLNPCYVSPVLTALEIVRYTKHTCTLARYQIMARKQQSGKAPTMMLDCMISKLFLKLCILNKSVAA
jgi:hypothetical protein